MKFKIFERNFAILVVTLERHSVHASRRGCMLYVEGRALRLIHGKARQQICLRADILTRSARGNKWHGSLTMQIFASRQRNSASRVNAKNVVRLESICPTVHDFLLILNTISRLLTSGIALSCGDRRAWRRALTAMVKSTLWCESRLPAPRFSGTCVLSEVY